jgi:hypothetical protein
MGQNPSRPSPPLPFTFPLCSPVAHIFLSFSSPSRPSSSPAPANGLTWHLTRLTDNVNPANWFRPQHRSLSCRPSLNQLCPHAKPTSCAVLHPGDQLGPLSFFPSRLQRNKGRFIPKSNQSGRENPKFFDMLGFYLVFGLESVRGGSPTPL